MTAPAAPAAGPPAADRDGAPTAAVRHATSIEGRRVIRD